MSRNILIKLITPLMDLSGIPNLYQTQNIMLILDPDPDSFPKHSYLSYMPFRTDHYDYYEYKGFLSSNFIAFFNPLVYEVSELTACS